MLTRTTCSRSAGALGWLGARGAAAARCGCTAVRDCATAPCACVRTAVRAVTAACAAASCASAAGSVPVHEGALDVIPSDRREGRARRARCDGTLRCGRVLRRGRGLRCGGARGERRRRRGNCGRGYHQCGGRPRSAGRHGRRRSVHGRCVRAQCNRAAGREPRMPRRCDGVIGGCCGERRARRARRIGRLDGAERRTLQRDRPRTGWCAVSGVRRRVRIYVRRFPIAVRRVRVRSRRSARRTSDRRAERREGGRRGGV